MIRSAAASAAAVPMLPGGEYHGTTPSKRAARGRDSAPCTPSQAPGWCHARNNTFGAEEARAKIDVFFFFAENFENSEPTDFFRTKSYIQGGRSLMNFFVLNGLKSSDDGGGRRGCGGIGRAAHRGADLGHPLRRFKVPLVRPPRAPGSAPASYDRAPPCDTPYHPQIGNELAKSIRFERSRVVSDRPTP